MSARTVRLAEEIAITIAWNHHSRPAGELAAQELAARARTVLTGAENGTLIIATSAGQPSQRSTVAVREDDGDVLVFSDTDSAIGKGANARRLASLIVHAVDGRTQVTVSGRLSNVNRSHQSACLSVEQVHLRAIGTGSDPLGWQIPLALYALAEPEPLAADIFRIVAHLNRSHEADLRLAAARLAGVCPQQLLATSMYNLTTRGLALCVISHNGADVVEVPFDRPAADMVDLAAKVRTVLTHKPH